MNEFSPEHQETQAKFEVAVVMRGDRPQTDRVRVLGRGLLLTHTSYRPPRVRQ